MKSTFLYFLILNTALLFSCKTPEEKDSSPLTRSLEECKKVDGDCWLPVNSVDSPETEKNTTMTSSSVKKFNGAWIVQKVKGIDITSFDSMRFDFVDGTLYGSGPCRSFQTTYGPDTQNLLFSPFEIGGGLCDEQTMITERNMFKLIEFVTRLEIDSDGLLIMYNFEEPQLWAKELGQP